MALTGANWRLYKRLSGPGFRALIEASVEESKVPLADFVDDPKADAVEQRIARLAHILEKSMHRMRLSAEDRNKAEFAKIADQILKDRGC